MVTGLVKGLEEGVGEIPGDSDRVILVVGIGEEDGADFEETLFIEYLHLIETFNFCHFKSFSL